MAALESEVVVGDEVEEVDVEEVDVVDEVEDVDVGV